eukprot:638560-Pyramimonas_sp.AAC.1
MSAPQVAYVHWGDTTAYRDILANTPLPAQGEFRDVRVFCLEKSEEYTLTARAMWDDGEPSYRPR